MEAEKAKGTPYCYRFRVPKHQDVVIDDSVRGKITFSTDNLGDFVIMRSNGLPVYNFCVAADDALMKITHVIRADEHLPNTLRQVGCHAMISIRSSCHIRSQLRLHELLPMHSALVLPAWRQDCAPHALLLQGKC